MKLILTCLKPLDKETGYYFALMAFIAEKWGLTGALLFFIFDLLVIYFNSFLEAYLEDNKKSDL